MEKEKKKTTGFARVFLTFVAVTIVLYGIGSLFSLEWLMLESSFHVGDEGFSFHFGSLIPIAMGLVTVIFI
ncbi:hypothetical protein [Bacillus sp. Marseille-P3800]|uniref:hypothetical protein n=1 Tax=Bacillus sp. Marseille-P3800 TaxID=2014782 RepID=UPI000C079C22|nr:hypothetical protein [Bacillus sp. Marseille-P3800]